MLIVIQGIHVPAVPFVDGFALSREVKVNVVTTSYIRPLFEMRGVEREIDEVGVTIMNESVSVDTWAFRLQLSQLVSASFRRLKGYYSATPILMHQMIPSSWLSANCYDIAYRLPNQRRANTDHLSLFRQTALRSYKQCHRSRNTYVTNCQ